PSIERPSFRERALTLARHMLSLEADCARVRESNGVDRNYRHRPAAIVSRPVAGHWPAGTLAATASGATGLPQRSAGRSRLFFRAFAGRAWARIGQAFL